MKKLTFATIVFFMFSFNIFAYSKYLIPGGESIGINIESDGLIVVGYYKVGDEYIARNNIKIGDRITKINNINVTSINELTNIINDKINNNEEVNIELIRNKKILNTTLPLKEENNIYKTGLYVKDNVIGIGTLTYIDPVTKIYGSLGHSVMLSETNTNVEVRNGNILMSKVTSIDKSRNGNVGSKNANINNDKILGTITKNTNYGLFGKYTSNLPNKEKYEISDYNSIEKGKAKILTVINDKKVEEFDINILEKYNSKKNTNKAFAFEIVDNKLLEKSGGIVQGMSGSPIIQNGKLIGAVTNVLIDDVTLGFGISIITMLEESER